MKKPLNALLILIGLFFFVNPNVSVVDVLPDAIGAALIVIGFLHFADIDERARQAQKALGILAFVDAGKTLTLLLLRQSEGTAWSLIFTFVFGIGEAALFAYGMCKLFSGITYRAQRLDCAALLNGFSALNALTILVAILKNLLVILPELTKLTDEYGEVSLGAAGSVQTAHFVYTALTVLNVAVVTIYGVGWWIYMLRYFKTVAKQDEFIEKLDAQYTKEVGSKPQTLTYRALKTAGVLVFASLVFLLPLYLDGVDHLPDFAAGALLILAILRLQRLYPKPAKPALIAGAVYTLFAIAEWTGELIFRATLAIDLDAGYYISVSTILLRHPAKLYAYFTVIALGALKYIAFFVFIWLFARIFRPIIAQHTGAAFETSSAHAAMKDMEIKARLTRLLNALLVFGAVAAVCGIVRRLFRMFNEVMIIEYIELIGVLPLAALFVIFLYKLEDGIDNKYFLEK